MPDSPMTGSSGAVKLDISANGSRIAESIEIASVSVTSMVNKIPFARIELLDGDMPNKDFPISSSDDFKPGNEIKIAAGYGDSEDTIFEGVIVRHGIKISGDNDSRLVIECRDKAFAMTLGRHNANFVDSKDSDIIKKIIANYSGLDADVDATKTEYKELVQYFCSDWDFILSRAEVNGLLVCVENAKVSVKAPQTSSAAELKLTYGDDLIELDADIDARTQFAEVNTASWDPGSQQVIEDQAGPQQLNKQGNLESKILAGVGKLDALRLQTTGLLDKGALKDWAEAQQVKAGLARIRGSMKFQGSARARAGGLIELDGVGDRFNGDVFVSAVVHRLSSGNWISEVEFGLSPDWFAERRDLVAPPASGWLPGVEGLQIGVVVKLDEDPEQQNRIQVKVPILQADTEGVWARLANFYASNEFGAFFIPEIGDEVILGYLNNDPCNPVILGSLYSSKLPPANALDADNNIKALQTRSGLKVEFDEDKKIISITTPEGNKLVFSEEDKSILMEDQNGNKVELGDGGITLDSPKDININAQGDIALTATGKIDIAATGDASLKGMNVNLEANTGLTAKGNATAELSASGQTTVKGAMVMIN